MTKTTRNATTAGAIAAVALVLLAPRPGAAILPYTFTKFADTTDGFTEFGNVTISPTGGLSWYAVQTAPPEAGIFGGSGAAINAVATEADGFEAFGDTPSRVEATTIFTARPLGGTGFDVYRSSGAGVPPLLVADACDARDAQTVNGVDFAYREECPVIGSIRFVGFGGTGVWGIGSQTGPSLNSVGETAFDSIYANPSFPVDFEVGTFRAGPTSPLMLMLAGAEPPSINDSGTVAIAGDASVITGSGGGYAVIASITGGVWAGFSDAAINNRGLVIFRGTQSGGTVGLYAGPDPVTDAILETGDAFFGSTVTAIRFVEEGLNDQAQIAFYAELADGRRGVYRGDPVFAPLPHAMAQGPITLPDTLTPLPLDGSASTGTGEPIVDYKWDLDGDGVFDLASVESAIDVEPSVYLQFLKPGRNDARLRVSAASGFYSIAPFQILLPTACSDGADNDEDGPIDFPADTGCTSAYDDFSEEPDCSDGLDNDGDGAADFPADPGCANALAPVEDPACNNGYDDDGDGGIDTHPDIGDPGCSAPSSNRENPQCNDGVDNDGDTLIDLADPGCKDKPFRNQETASSCGVGAELVVVALALAAGRRRVGRRRARGKRDD